jgi:RNA recognition motif-containing protein
MDSGGVVQFACDQDVEPHSEVCTQVTGMTNMNNKLFVGNISFKMSEADLAELFSQSGKVLSVAIPTDRDTGRKRGFAFVEMENDADAQAAIEAFNGKNIQGREIVVNPSRPKERQTNMRRDS